MVLLLTGLIAVVSSAAAPDPWRLSLLLVAMLGSQLSIGWSNDYLDRQLDARHQPWKPLVSGAVDPRLLPVAIGFALLASLAAGLVLGALPMLFLVLGTGCGLGYNLWLKRTRYSLLAFVLAFIVLPLFVWTSLDLFRYSFLALYPIGLSLPIAVHVANVLPDLEADGEQGRITIAVGLGRPRSVALIMACEVAPLPLIALSTVWLDYDWVLFAGPLAAHAVLSLAAGFLYVSSKTRGSAVWAFRLLVTASIAFAGGWLAALR